MQVCCEHQSGTPCLFDPQLSFLKGRARGQIHFGTCGWLRSEQSLTPTPLVSGDPEHVFFSAKRAEAEA